MSRPDTTSKNAKPRDPDDSDKLGMVIDGRYRLLELIGRGGMGVVYKAEHVGIGRMVAVKLLHPTLASVPELAKRFEREALAIGRIEHPNCVDVSDTGKLADGSLYLVMEYLQGQSAGDLMADLRRIEPRRALHIMRHVLRGLGHAHAAEIVHRDIKPENIFLVEQDGDPDFAKILDFGIAKLLSGEDAPDSVKLTQAGVAFGTPVYMSPEQAVGNPVDSRADLYAATIVLYEMIAGIAPFFSDDKLEVMSMHTTRPPPPFSESAPDLALPPGLEAMVMTGLAKRPGDRFASTDDYIAAIDSVLHGESALTPPAPQARHIPKRLGTVPVLYPPPPRATTAAPALIAASRKDRKRALIAAAAMGAVVLVAIATALLVRGSSADTEPADIEFSSDTLARAAEQLASGDAEGAVSALEAAGPHIANNASAQLMLGNAYAKTSRQRDAVRAYDRALMVDDTLITDPDLLANLHKIQSGSDAELSLDAADTLLSRANDPTAVDQLIAIASKEKKRKTRQRARDLAMKHGLAERIDRVYSYALDLSQGPRCADRRRAALELERIGDPRALPYLKKARRRRSSRRKYRGKNINACLKDDVERAIAALTAIKSGEAATPATKSPTNP